MKRATASSSWSSSSDRDGAVLPPSVLPARPARPHTASASGMALPTARRGGASGRSLRSLTADEDSRAVQKDACTMRAIVDSTRSEASARAALEDVAKRSWEMQAAAATRAAEATLEATKLQLQLYMMRERRESRESGELWAETRGVNYWRGTRLQPQLTVEVARQGRIRGFWGGRGRRRRRGLS